ncbi:thiamine ABC transporter substrate binding subunit [Marinobacter nanhaiticus D15-8W]|uniref:Thiamine ABC transporter substrate binding subunit n=1 Tax=Marinobacter nanhaiticus D15-8W TaxID=626887 RepID=N6W9K4_9GAMM|nr:thiamine ABC transporter substrate binding subunit [Marinobacter nanhaiticus D15-8W]
MVKTLLPTTAARSLSLLLLSFLFIAAGRHAVAAPTLTIYTYPSFVSEWGPGPAIKTSFEARCDCTLEFIALDSSVAILHRLRLEGESTRADLVLGLDANIMAEARKTGLLAPHGIDTSALELPINWQDDIFVPYDWGYFAFVYDTEQLTNPPSSLEALIDAPDDLKIILQDPRTSTPGLGFLLWMRHVYGDQAPEKWQALQDNILTVSKGWSDAYFSLFMNGEAPMVLSYSTSPAYHMAVDNTDRYQAVAFEEGHYLQVEVAALVRTSQQPALARQFLEFMLTPAFQQEIPLKNVMYPAIDLGQQVPDVFDRLIDPPETLYFQPETVADHRKQWIDEWLNATTR